MSDHYSVVIVEDDPPTRIRLAQKLDELDTFNVAAALGTLAEARAQLSTATPDVLLVDLGLPDGSGLTLIQEQSQARPDLPILVISVLGDERSVISAIESGARGYLLKSDTGLAIEQCLKQLLAGGAPISASIAKHLIKRLQHPVDSETHEADADAPALSERELEVLQLAAKGYTYQDIAELLNVKISTVSSYTRRLYQKLAVHSRGEAVFEAMRMGLVKKPE